MNETYLWICSWRYHVRTYLGREITGIDQYNKQLKQLILRDCGLYTLFSLHHFPFLEYLDVSGNFIRTILGCEKLQSFVSPFPSPFPLPLSFPFLSPSLPFPSLPFRPLSCLPLGISYLPLPPSLSFFLFPSLICSLPFSSFLLTFLIFLLPFSLHLFSLTSPIYPLPPLPSHSTASISPFPLLSLPMVLPLASPFMPDCLPSYIFMSC